MPGAVEVVLRARAIRSADSRRMEGGLSVVARIDALVVLGARHPDPIRLFDAAFVTRRRAHRECRGNLDPPVLLRRDGADLVCDLREILILAEDQSDVIVSPECTANNVKGEAHIHALLLADEN